MAQITRIVNVKRQDEHNAGDAVCSPLDYFAFPVPVTKCDIYLSLGLAPDDETLIILGGGGLFHFRGFVEHVLASWKHVVLWGMGFNAHGQESDEPPRLFGHLAGLRDKTSKHWVPCPSCISALLDNQPPPEHDTVYYAHQSHDLPRLRGSPYLTNRVAFDEAIRFLSSGKTVVTNSYHGAYWASLMGRKVIVRNPWSSKFNYAFFGERTLAQCRSANLDFYRLVMERYFSPRPTEG